MNPIQVHIRMPICGRHRINGRVKAMNAVKTMSRTFAPVLCSHRVTHDVAELPGTFAWNLQDTVDRNLDRLAQSRPESTLDRHHAGVGKPLGWNDQHPSLGPALLDDLERRHAGHVAYHVNERQPV